MPYNFSAESFHTKKFCSRLSSRKAQFCIRKTKNFRFWGPLWGLGTTYAVHLRLIGKLVVDFLLVKIEHFAGCFRFVTIHAFDGQTDGRTDGQTALSWLSRCIQCSAVKMSISRWCLQKIRLNVCVGHESCVLDHHGSAFHWITGSRITNRHLLWYIAVTGVYISHCLC